VDGPVSFHDFAGGVHDRYEVLDAGEYEDIGLVVIEVTRHAFVRLARYRGRGEAPAEPEGPVARAGIVAQSELRPEAIATGAGRDRHLKLGADTANRPAALGQ
jgi:hypothetical protein